MFSDCNAKHSLFLFMSTETSYSEKSFYVINFKPRVEASLDVWKGKSPGLRGQI